MKRVPTFLSIMLITACVSLNDPPMRPAAEAVIVPDSAGNACKQTQAKHFDELKTFAEQTSMVMGLGSIGCVEIREKKYFAIKLHGPVYNTVATSLGGRLSKEFMEKYKTIAEKMIAQPIIKDVEGLRVILYVQAYNFVVKDMPHDELLEVVTPINIVQQFIAGDITSQQLLDQSIVFVNGQRTDFKLILAM